jgi:holliday junction DNA helicase RuvA
MEVAPSSRLANEAVEALVALGIPKATAEKNVETVIKQQGTQLSLEELIKFTFKTR